jgi:hypothetical protein
MNRVFLSNAPRGELLVVGSSSQNKHYRGVLVRIAGASLSVQRAIKGKGIVLLSPTLTDKGLTVPIELGGDVANVFTPRIDVGKGVFHLIEDCL